MFYYEGKNHVVDTVAQAMAANDSMFIAGGVTFGSRLDVGVTAQGNASLTVFGTLLSLANTAFDSAGGFNSVSVGVGGAIVGSNAANLACALHLGGHSIIDNDGTITGRTGINIAGSDNTIDNTGIIRGSGASSGTAGEGAGIVIAGGDFNFITNSGTISSANSAGILIFDNGLNFDVIDNSGTISGASSFVAIQTGNSAAFITNSGHINGAVIMGTGADSYDGTEGIVTSQVLGGDGDDAILCGRGRNFLEGGAGADELEGGAGRDTFFYNAATESSVAFDTINDFDVFQDRIDLPFAVTGIDPIKSGPLRSAHFAADVRALFPTEAELGKHHAALFFSTTTGGDLGNRVFIVIDADNKGGFTANKDYIIEVTGSVANHLDALSAFDFI